MKEITDSSNTAGSGLPLTDLPSCMVLPLVPMPAATPARAPGFILTSSTLPVLTFPVHMATALLLLGLPHILTQIPDPIRLPMRPLPLPTPAPLIFAITTWRHRSHLLPPSMPPFLFPFPTNGNLPNAISPPPLSSNRPFDRSNRRRTLNPTFTPPQIHISTRPKLPH